MTTKQTEIARESLDRARNGNPNSNYSTILREFAERGLSLDEIRPRENVFTYQAWRALGRQVRRGEDRKSVV